MIRNWFVVGESVFKWKFSPILLSFAFQFCTVPCSLLSTYIAVMKKGVTSPEVESCLNGIILDYNPNTVLKVDFWLWSSILYYIFSQRILDQLLLFAWKFPRLTCSTALIVKAFYLMFNFYIPSLFTSEHNASWLLFGTYIQVLFSLFFLWKYL